MYVAQPYLLPESPSFASELCQKKMHRKALEWNTLISCEMRTTRMGGVKGVSDCATVKSEDEVEASSSLEKLDDIPLNQLSKIPPISAHVAIKTEKGSSICEGCNSAPVVEERPKVLSAGQTKRVAGGLGISNSSRIVTDTSVGKNQIPVAVANLTTVGVEGHATDAAFSHESQQFSSDSLVQVKIECSDNDSMSVNCLSDLSGVKLQATKTEALDYCFDDLDHIVLKERRRMLLSRKLFGQSKPMLKGVSSGLSAPITQNQLRSDLGFEKQNTHFRCRDSLTAGNNVSNIDKDFKLGTFESHSAIVSCPSSGCSTVRNGPSKSRNDQSCLSDKTSIGQEPSVTQNLVSECDYLLPSLRISAFANMKAEPTENTEVKTQRKRLVGSCLVPIKTELQNVDDYYENILDNMLLRERMKLLGSRKGPKSNPFYSFKCSGELLSSSSVDCEPVGPKYTMPLKVIRPWKKRRTATDSVTTALEEDAPGLLQVLVDEGVVIDEIKLYGVTESNEALDESLIEESFSELETVISKIFSQRESFLKLSPMKCSKGEKSCYCLACLLSLIDQAKYLQFRKWPVEWGWCRDLQSFIFVFPRHNRIVMERPEYGYATYFFELVETMPINWQIKRLVTVMKLTTCGRTTLIENKELMVGEGLTEGEASVLVEYGWIPNTGLGTMLNYCDRVYHDRKSEGYNTEWKSKIGKILVDGYNAGKITLTDIQSNPEDCIAAESLQIKLEV